MKTLLAYIVWNKHDMITWLCSGIVKTFKPGEVDVLFLLDNPIDGTDQLFIDNIPQDILKGFDVKCELFYANPINQFKFNLQNIALERAIEQKYDLVICPQDDQKLEDPFLMENIKRVHERYGDSIGLIGGRDGFDKLDYKNGTGSLFSHPVGENYKWLKNGDYQPQLLLNDGPLIYFRSTIEKVGYHDEGFKVFMSEVDYCKRCTAAGLQNVNLGMSVVHEKFKTFRSNVYYTRHNYSELDSQRFRDKWGT